MDARVIIVLLFSGVCLTSAGLDKYAFINERKTWFDAQAYCRSRNGDLASARNKEDVILMTDITGWTESWIGLNDLNRETMDLYRNSWRWSTHTKSRSGYMNFAPGEPNYANENEECVDIWSDGTWTDGECYSSLNFVCFSGQSTNKTYHHVNLNETWASAKDYCRTNYTDLAMIENEEENQLASSNVTDPAWIGLSRRAWTYSEATKQSFRHWWSYEPDNRSGKQFCASVYRNGFSDMDCTSELPFLCSDGIARKQSRIKIMIQSNLDLTNQYNKDSMLQQLSASLTRAGQTDFNLSWSTPAQKLDPTGLNDDHQ
ncbi:L-selectin-like [Gadus morhua]|uniref:L-selectin-like n=1 Tax=Gadus morhua TaxID=8049 RepID=A0A8C5C4P4_GADMO|nr:L-selectin-like [Gadus morhua]